ncbi:MAG TPA: heavy metal-associated domain-containing protein [Streptosporangiaceae bacterium]|nr:heavy metal-associated domain-containing protein [Streptosporangiaceae bacterium]
MIDGVHSAEVNLATEAATVSFDPQSAGLSELTAAVAAAGYTATAPARRRRPAGAAGRPGRGGHGRGRAGRAAA